MNLKELAKLKGTNIKQLAEKCNIPASTLYAISSGDTNFDNVGISVFIKIADALGMKAEELYDAQKTNYYIVPLDEPEEHDGPKQSDESKRPDECDELCELYRSMTDEGRSQLMIYARGLAATYPKSQVDTAEEIA